MYTRDLECMTEFSRRQTTGCVELFSLACNILITRAYERILPCVYCITMYVTQNAVCNCEIKSILTYLLTYLAANASDFIVKLPILRPSLRLYDFNVKSYDFYARQLSYYLRCINEWLLANIISMIFIRQYGANENDFHFCFQHKYGKL